MAAARERPRAPAARVRCAARAGGEIGPDMQLLNPNPRRLADSHVAEVHRHTWINRRGDTSDLNGLPKRFRQLLGQRRPHAVLREDGPRPDEEAEREDEKQKDRAKQDFLEHDKL